MQNIYEAVSRNKRSSAIIVVVFFLFTAVCFYFLTQALGLYMGYSPGGLGYLGIALIISGLTSMGSYYFSDKIVLAISGAKEASRKEYFDYYTISENLALSTGLPKPKLYVIKDSAMNAFATGRNPEKAVICATTGLLEGLTRTELEGVIAHELSHVKNYDMRLQSVVAVLVGTIALLGDWFLRMRWFGRGDKDRDSGQIGALLMFVGIIFAILSPIIAQLIQLAISRKREFLADSGSVSITRQPSGLISALKKISNDHEPLEAANKATAHLFIVNPFKDKIGSNISRFSNLFNTHPPINERINALEKML